MTRMGDGVAVARREAGLITGEGEAPPGYKWQVLVVAGAGIFMSTLSNGIVNVALPVLTREFDASLVLAQWVVLAYVLCITGLLLPAGRLADMAGRKEVFLGGFVVFAVGAALCTVAPSLPWLIAARVLQGIGGAFVQANSGALITQAFPPRERGRALGLNGSFVSAGALAGPMVGGLITAHLGWRASFLAILAVSAVATPAGWWLLRKSPVKPGQRFDLAGAALFLLATGSLMLALNGGPVVGWLAPPTLGLASLAAVAAVAFVMVERRVAQPTVDFALFANRGFATAVVAGFLSFMAISGNVLLMPFYFQYVLHEPPDRTGMYLIAAPVTMMLLAPVGGWLSDRSGARAITTVGLVLEVAVLALMTTLGVDTHPLAVSGLLVLMGVALALFNPPNSNAMFSSVPPTHLGLVGGFQALSRNLGQSLGQTVAGVLWSVGTLAAAGGVVTTTQAAPEAMMAGFHLAYGVAAVLAVAALAVAVVARPRTVRVAAAPA